MLFVARLAIGSGPLFHRCMMFFSYYMSLQPMLVEDSIGEAAVSPLRGQVILSELVMSPRDRTLWEPRRLLECR